MDKTYLFILGYVIILVGEENEKNSSNCIYSYVSRSNY